MNWVPDGIVLSKRENGPAAIADAEYDARSGLLFNIGIAGPSVTKTWTGDYRLEAQPMDKVFMLVARDLDMPRPPKRGGCGCDHPSAQAALTAAHDERDGAARSREVGGADRAATALTALLTASALLAAARDDPLC